MGVPGTESTHGLVPRVTGSSLPGKERLPRVWRGLGLFGPADVAPCALWCCFHSVPALPRQLLPARLSAGSGAEQRVGLHPGLARGSRPFWGSKASDISDEVQELDLENILPILAGRWGPGVEPSAPCASRVKHCQYEIMFQLQDQTDWFNSYHESILLYYHALTL